MSLRSSAELNVDAARIAVMGRDAGAALVACLAQRMFDNEGPPILMQILHQPMLDCDATPSRREFQRTPGLNGPAVSLGVGPLPWACHGERSSRPRSPDEPGEGLPPTYVSCSEIDPCRDEAIDCANGCCMPTSTPSYTLSQRHSTALTQLCRIGLSLGEPGSARASPCAGHSPCSSHAVRRGRRRIELRSKTLYR